MNKRKLVVLTGAGISAESGLKTFRDGDGLWEGYRIEDVATPRAWRKDPAMVLAFYNERRKAVREAEPNAAHYALAQLETYFDVQIVTQNIDDLHERAGSTAVLHLHGEIFKMRSEKNEFKTYPITGDIRLGDRAEDGGQYRPNIVWFEEPVPLMEAAVPMVARADIFAVVGTSLVVYPAASLLLYVPRAVAKYLIDRRIPPVSEFDNVIPIEKSATEGVPLLKELLLAEANAG